MVSLLLPECGSILPNAFIAIIWFCRKFWLIFLRVHTVRKVFIWNGMHVTHGITDMRIVCYWFLPLIFHFEYCVQPFVAFQLVKCLRSLHAQHALSDTCVCKMNFVYVCQPKRLQCLGSKYTIFVRRMDSHRRPVVGRRMLCRQQFIYLYRFGIRCFDGCCWLHESDNS